MEGTYSFCFFQVFPKLSSGHKGKLPLLVFHEHSWYRNPGMILWLTSKTSNFFTSDIYFGYSGTSLLREQRVFCVLPYVRKIPEDVVQTVKAWFLYWPCWMLNVSVYFLILKLPEKNGKKYPLIYWDSSFKRSLMKHRTL